MIKSGEWFFKEPIQTAFEASTADKPVSLELCLSNGPTDLYQLIDVGYDAIAVRRYNTCTVTYIRFESIVFYNIRNQEIWTA